MEEAIRNFPKQFEWEPEIQNAAALVRKNITIVAGMGGSHLAADLMNAANPLLDIIVHNDYGLENIPEGVLQNSLVVANSYSGNTEETISAFEEALQKHVPVAAISTGGKLLELAKQNNIPYIQIPNTGIQPRSALGFMFLALAKIISEENLMREAKAMALRLSPEKSQEEGKKFAKTLKGKIPVVYASQRNSALAYNWKIKFNETSKIPAFCNAFPELNHNEMNGFECQNSAKKLCEKFCFILLEDESNHPKIQKRMRILKEMYEKRKLQVFEIGLRGSSRLEKLFSSSFLADWVSYYLALEYKADSEQVPMVEEFKRFML